MIRPTEPIWKSLIVETKGPIFTPEQCQQIINKGESLKQQQAEVGSAGPDGRHDTKKRITTISWIGFKEMPEMYKVIEDTVVKANNNHFGFDGIQLTEQAQYTHYPVGGFYEWHTDNDVIGINQPPVRKISMTALLSPENEFEGGELELMEKGKRGKLQQGQAIFFASFIPHRVKPILKGERKSLVMWFGGPSFR